MKNKEVVKKQYETWVSTYDKDKFKIINDDTGIELEKFVERILNHCYLEDGQKILDVGTGTGLIAMSIAKKTSGNCRITGIDITKAMLDEAKINIKRETLEGVISLEKASAESIPCKNDIYDLTICVFTIRHTDIKKVLGELMRVLKSQGKVIIVDLYAPEKWRSQTAKIIMPIFKLFFMLKKERKSEKESQVLTLEEWKILASEIGGKDIQIEEFPNIDEPDWKPGKLIISWSKN